MARAIAAVAAVAVTAVAAQAANRANLRDPWSAQEVATLASMRLKEAGPRPADPSNAYEQRAEAAALGRALFTDKRLSRNGEVACASCHAADKQFQDGRQFGEGLGQGKRRTMPVMGAAHAPFLFWDGRKDSLWSQALGPFEDAAEHGGNRVRLARLVQAHYGDSYQAVFGPMPALGKLPDDASPAGTDAERAAWATMTQGSREAVNRVFANMGKAIAAFERKVSYGESRFDRYAEATAAGDARGQEVLSPREVRGLRLFLGKGQCATCHNGPLLTDHAFHNTGVPPIARAVPDRGRADGVRKLLQDEFNCLGPYSDARPEQCGELQFLATDDPGQLAAFRTPGLRNVAERAPYMHAGQFSTLEQVVQHYATSPKAVTGHSELAQPGERHADRQAIRLSAADIQDLAAFLRTLTGPVVQAGPVREPSY
ncbi:cytochrome-c peroxidase [Ramlibacter monticola]|uniref:Cytochrome-c peroxidase n=1 Tax=Ramlibacter monticola TaxID=1926872 RepID=A0A936Z0N1_9BURK|nr:cytochrome c peroxidase [Ramlibacter monticola]MBL0391465.1 cytochrome-c peroxidase [Ramlibacter monticola]